MLSGYPIPFAKRVPHPVREATGWGTDEFARVSHSLKDGERTLSTARLLERCPLNR